MQLPCKTNAAIGIGSVVLLSLLTVAVYRFNFDCKLPLNLERQASSSHKFSHIAVVAPTTYSNFICYFDGFVKMLRLQTMKPREVIIVVSSVDSEQQYQTVELLQNMTSSEAPCRIQLIPRKGRQNAAENRNIGVSFVTSPLVTLFDIDDAMHPKRLEIMEQIFNEHRDLEVLYHTFRPTGKREEMLRFDELNHPNLTLQISFDGLYSEYSKFLKANPGSKLQFCCSFIPGHPTIHNAWSTMRTYVWREHPQNASAEFETMEDSLHTTELSLRYNVSYIDVTLGNYLQKSPSERKRCSAPKAIPIKL